MPIHLRHHGFPSLHTNAFGFAADYGVAATRSVPGILERLVFTKGLSDAEAVGSIEAREAMAQSLSAQFDSALQLAVAYLKNVASSALGTAQRPTSLAAHPSRKNA